MKYILSLVLAFNVVFGFSQVPGYMGKRASIQYKAGITPSFRNPNYFSEPSTYDDYSTNSIGPFDLSHFGFSFNHSFEFEYVLSNYSSISCIYGMFRTNMERNEGVDEIIFIDPYNSSNYDSDYTDLYYFGKMNGKTFGLGVTLYFRKYAPVGGYFKTVLSYVPYTVETVAISNYDSNIDFDRIFVDKKYWTYMMTIELGRRRIYFNRLITSVAVRAGAVTSAFIKDDITNLNFVSEYSNRRVRDMFNLNLNLGVGWLLF